MKNQSSLLLFGVILVLAATAPIALAEDATTDWPWLRLSSFGTLGLVYDNRDVLHPQRDLSQPDTFDGHWSWRMDSLLGVQINADLPKGLEAVAQLVLKDRAVETLDSNLEWAFLRWRSEAGLAVRLGRMGVDFYRLSDYRDVSFAYLWERPPVEFYGPLILRHVDGGDLAYSIQLRRGTVRAKLYVGQSRQYVEMATGLGAEALDMHGVWGGSVTYENERWQLKAGLLRFRFANGPATLDDPAGLGALNTSAVQGWWPQAADVRVDMTPADKRIGFYALGAAYDDNRWLVSGELGVLSSEWSPLRDSLSAYVSLGKRFGNMTPYLVLAGVWPLEADTRLDPPAPAALADPNIAALHQGARSFYDGLSMDQQTLSLGLRWDVRPELALKVQWDHVAAARSALWWDGGLLTHDTSAELLSASLSWMF